MKLAWRIVGIMAMAVLASLGCGRKTANEPTKPAAQKPSLPLPEWAPKNPSPEFLRAARVLKPLPAEVVTGARSTAAGQAFWIAYRRTLPALYEFFGTLMDQQVERLLSTKEVRIPMKSLSAKQRAALDRWFDVWRDEMQKVPSEAESADRRVLLYKSGIKEDFSNAYVGFVVEGHVVNIKFWGDMPDGHVEGGGGVTFATL